MHVCARHTMEGLQVVPATRRGEDCRGVGWKGVEAAEMGGRQREGRSREEDASGREVGGVHSCRRARDVGKRERRGFCLGVLV